MVNVLQLLLGFVVAVVFSLIFFPFFFLSLSLWYLYLFFFSFIVCGVQMGRLQYCYSFIIIFCLFHSLFIFFVLLVVLLLLLLSCLFQGLLWFAFHLMLFYFLLLFLLPLSFYLSFIPIQWNEYVRKINKTCTTQYQNKRRKKKTHEE